MRLRWQSHFLWGGARGSASGLRQGSALHPRRVFDPLDTLFAIELVTLSYWFRVFIGGTQGALPLDSAKGSSTLWTPFRAIQLVTTAYNARVFIEGTQGSSSLDPFARFS